MGSFNPGTVDKHYAYDIGVFFADQYLQEKKEQV